jgi:hypothetical protein
LFFSIVIVEDGFISHVFVNTWTSFKIHLLSPLSGFLLTFLNLFLHVNLLNALIIFGRPFLAFLFDSIWAVVYFFVRVFITPTYDLRRCITLRFNLMIL